MKKPSWDFSDMYTIFYFTHLKPLLIATGFWGYYIRGTFSINHFLYFVTGSMAQTLQSYFASTVLCKYVALASVVFALKFILLVALLVFVRGGIPRYRYDFLTKVGWIQMLNFILLVLFLLMLHYLSL
jgi:NADH:ubiquinone oxidoreductase subunit H